MYADTPMPGNETVCSIPVSDFVRRVKDFHGAIAPGVILGGYMVNLACLHLPTGDILFDALSETRACLPDAIQILTPCTIGNGWLKILDLGRFALSLYDKSNGSGVRVFVDTAKLESFPEIKAWFFKLKTKKEQDLEVLLDEIQAARSQVCRVTTVKLKPEIFAVRRRGAFRVCPICHESYPVAHGDCCRACTNLGDVVH